MDSHGILALIIVMVLFVSYFTPGMVASYRHHHYETAIIIFNLFLGWTFLGWVVALVWAFVDPAVADRKSRSMI